MPTVFLRNGNSVFHRVEDCVQLLKKPARGVPHPIEDRDLSDLIGVRPCRTCYTDAPRKPKLARRHCPICNKSRAHPCPHNGGVPVSIRYTTRYVGLLRDPGEQVVKPIYVWPDQLYRYPSWSSPGAATA